MGKQRTPQGRSTGRGGSPRPARAGTPPAAAEAARAAAEDPIPAAPPASTPEPLHAHLMDTVSPEALGTGETPPDAASATEPPAAPTNVVPLKAVASERRPEPAPPAPGEAPVQLSDGTLPAPASWRAGRRPVPPLRQDLEDMGQTLFAFMRSESAAIITHLNALKDARSPADAIRLQVTEIQRAADASLTCWSEIARRATRMVAQR